MKIIADPCDPSLPMSTRYLRLESSICNVENMMRITAEHAFDLQDDTLFGSLPESFQDEINLLCFCAFQARDMFKALKQEWDDGLPNPSRNNALKGIT
jgi:hypothetical protein